MTKSVIRRTLEQLILEEHSRAQAQKIIAYLGTDAQRLEVFMACFFEGTGVVRQRSAAVVGKIEAHHPNLLHPYYAQMVEQLAGPHLHPAVLRNTLRVMENKQLNERLAGLLVDACFGFLEDNSCPVAVQAFSITCIFNHGRSFPSLIAELKMIIEPRLEWAKPAYRHRAREVLSWMPK